MVQKVFGTREAKNGTETGELLQTGTRMVHGSSKSSGEEDKRDAEIQEVRAQIEFLHKKSGGQGLPLEKESGLEEEWSK